MHKDANFLVTSWIKTQKTKEMFHNSRNISIM